MPQLSTSSDSSLMVSICVMSYNLEHYISETLDSILMQKVNFQYNIVVSDDCSTDKTREILQQYAAKYPDKITLLLQENNLGVVANFVETLKACRGKYIATLDGDDYWTDPLKLQKQVDFLESNKDFSIVFHNAEIRDETSDNVKIKPFNSEEKSREYTYDEIVKTWSVPTCSVLAINNEQYRYIENHLWFPVQDLPFYLSCASMGKIYYMSDTMGVYRRLLSCDLYSEKFKSFEFNLKLLEYYKVLYEDFSDILSEKTIGHLLAINYFWAALRYRKKGDEKEYFRHLTLGMAQDPEHTIKQFTKQKDNHIKSLQENLKLKNKTIQDLQEEVKQKNNHLHIIFGTISQLVRISGRTEPIKKFKAYKEMLKIYHKIKKDLILR